MNIIKPVNYSDVKWSSWWRYGARPGQPIRAQTTNKHSSATLPAKLTSASVAVYHIRRVFNWEEQIHQSERKQMCLEWMNVRGKRDVKGGKKSKGRREVRKKEQRASWAFNSIHSALSWAWWVQRGLKSGPDWTRRQLQAVNAPAAAQTKPQSHKTCFSDELHAHRKPFLIPLLMRSSLLWHQIWPETKRQKPHPFFLPFPFKSQTSCLQRNSDSSPLHRPYRAITPSPSKLQPCWTDWLTDWQNAPLSFSQPDMKTLPALSSRNQQPQGEQTSWRN